MQSKHTRQNGARFTVSALSTLATCTALSAVMLMPKITHAQESTSQSFGTGFFQMSSLSSPGTTSGTTTQDSEVWHFYQDLSPWSAMVSGNQSDLTQITSDRDTGVSVLSFVVDTSGVVQGIAFATTPASGTPTTQNFAMSDIQKGNGVVLMQSQGHDVFFLRGTINSAAGNGNLVIRYLANGLWGTYKECPAKVQRNSDGVWQIINSISGKVVNAARVETWNLGVTTVHGICTGDVNQ